MKSSLLLALGLLLTGTASVQAADIAAGKEKSAQCQSCHGVDGNSSDPQFPRLAGQHASYLEHALKGYRSGKRKNPIMAGFAQGLTDEEIADLSAYYASQQGLVTTVQPNRID